MRFTRSKLEGAIECVIVDDDLRCCSPGDMSWQFGSETGTVLFAESVGEVVNGRSMARIGRL